MLNFRIAVSGGARIEWRGRIYENLIAGSAAGELRKTVSAHLDARGGQSYWKEAAKRVETASTQDGAAVSINHRGVRLHYYGGTVYPTGRPSAVTGKPTKRLLIPTEESPLRKRRVALYELGLDKKAVHVEGGKLIADMGGVPVVLGLLARKAEHPADPTVLPGEADMAAALHTGASKALKRLNL